MVVVVVVATIRRGRWHQTVAGRSKKNLEHPTEADIMEGGIFVQRPTGTKPHVLRRARTEKR